MVAELCEFFWASDENDTRCLLAKDDSTCGGDTHNCTFPTELKKFNMACSDDWNADSDYENRGHRQ